MPTYNPQSNPNAPSDVTLLDIVQTYNTTNGNQFPTRWLNIAAILGPAIAPEWGNIATTPTIDNQKDLLSLVSLRI